MTVPRDLDSIEHDNFVLTGRLSAKESFAEGITQMFFGVPFIKVLFHTVIEPKNGDKPEIRKAQQILTMPTLFAIEFAHLILSSAKNSEMLLMENLNNNDQAKFKNLLKDIQSGELVEGYETKEIKTSAKKKG